MSTAIEALIKKARNDVKRLSDAESQTTKEKNAIIVMIKNPEDVRLDTMVERLDMKLQRQQKRRESAERELEALLEQLDTPIEAAAKPPNKRR